VEDVHFKLQMKERRMVWCRLALARTGLAVYLKKVVRQDCVRVL